MSILDIFLVMLVMSGIVGAGWILIALAVLAYGKIEKVILRKRIPQNIKEVNENERSQRDSRREEARRRYAGTGNPEVEQALGRLQTEAERIRTGTVDIKPEELRQIPSKDFNGDTGNTSINNAGSPQVEGRNEPTDRHSKRRKLRRLE